MTPYSWPLLAHGASAAGVVSAAPQGPSVEPVLELLAVLGFPKHRWALEVGLDSREHFEQLFVLCEELVKHFIEFLVPEFPCDPRFLCHDS